MLHSHDFDLGTSAHHDGDLPVSVEPGDPARGPSGIMLGLALGAMLWGAVIIAWLLLR